MQKKSLELACYVVGGGAFGVFIRWLQKQIAFNEEGLVDKSALNFLVTAYLVAMVIVFYRFVRDMKEDRGSVPEAFNDALRFSGKLFDIARWFSGCLMILGGIVLFATCETDPEALLLRILSVLAMISGAGFLYVSGAPVRDIYSIRLVCTLSEMPVLMYALWLITCYKSNDINSVLWSYSVEILTVCVAMAAFFRVSGFAFSAPDWKKAMTFSMLGGAMCIMTLADGRNFGQQLILLASALMLIFYVWVMRRNMVQGEAPVQEVPNDGFERL